MAWEHRIREWVLAFSSCAKATCCWVNGWDRMVPAPGRFPVGHLEYGEHPVACGRRELLEETGLVARTLVPGPYTSDLFDVEGRH
jgi:NUDIX domain